MAAGAATEEWLAVELIASNRTETHVEIGALLAEQDRPN
jgi:hypothetical protein